LQIVHLLRVGVIFLKFSAAKKKEEEEASIFCSHFSLLCLRIENNIKA